MADYNVWVHTSGCQGAGTEGRVAIELHGQEGSSGMQQLDTQQDAAFARGKVTIPNITDKINAFDLTLIAARTFVNSCAAPANSCIRLQQM